MELKITEKTLNAILQVLGQLPYSQVAQLITKISQEVSLQNQKEKE